MGEGSEQRELAIGVDDQWVKKRKASGITNVDLPPPQPKARPLPSRVSSDSWIFPMALLPEPARLLPPRKLDQTGDA